MEGEEERDVGLKNDAWSKRKETREVVDSRQKVIDNILPKAGLLVCGGAEVAHKSLDHDGEVRRVRQSV